MAQYEVAENLQVGDLVQLKSCGPVMTVVRVFPTDGSGIPTVNCVWFENGDPGVHYSYGKPYSMKFPVAALWKRNV